MEQDDLILTQRIFKGYAELAPLIRELSSVYLALSVTQHRIDHLYLSFRFYYCKTNRPNITQIIVVKVLLTARRSLHSTIF